MTDETAVAYECINCGNKVEQLPCRVCGTSWCRAVEPLQGCYDIVYSLDDGVYYADLLWNKRVTSPAFATAEKAHAWAREKGGTQRLRLNVVTREPEEPPEMKPWKTPTENG